MREVSLSEFSPGPSVLRGCSPLTQEACISHLNPVSTQLTLLLCLEPGGEDRGTQEKGFQILWKKVVYNPVVSNIVTACYCSVPKWVRFHYHYTDIGSPLPWFLHLSFCSSLITNICITFYGLLYLFFTTPWWSLQIWLYLFYGWGNWGSKG